MFTTKKSSFSLFLLVSILSVALSLSINLVQQFQDSRSKASTDTNTAQVSFKIAFKGIKPDYSCLSSLTNIDLKAVNVTSKAYQPTTKGLLTIVAGETNKSGDQVFLVSNQPLESKFNSLDSSNYLMVSNPSFLTSKLCLNQQASKIDNSIACNLNLSNTNTLTYDFSNYPLIPGDLNQDGVVNTSDFSIIKSNIDSSAETDCNKTGDINFDGIVNSLDIGYLKTVLLTTSDEDIIDTSTITPTPTNTPTPTATPTPTEVKFAVAADIHNCNSCLEKILKRAKNDGVQLMILAGDLTEGGTQSELENSKKVLDNSDINYVVTPGNHDVYKSLFDDVFGVGYQSIKIGGVKFILIDNSSYRGLDKGSGATTQQNWIKSEVGECKTIICVAIMHRPLNHSYSDHVMGEDNSNAASEARWLRSLLVDNGVKETESGHIHRFETYTIGGMKTNLVGAGQYSRFSEFTVDSAGNITRKQIQL